MVVWWVELSSIGVGCKLPTFHYSIMVSLSLSPRQTRGLSIQLPFAIQL